jgi:hypothetical protein
LRPDIGFHLYVESVIVFEITERGIIMSAPLVQEFALCCLWEWGASQPFKEVTSCTYIKVVGGYIYKVSHDLTCYPLLEGHRDIGKVNLKGSRGDSVNSD